MEPLDLTQQGPEEFEGKLLTYNNCDYVVGSYIATGGSKIVHQLLNQLSGLCLHVVKFWRNAEEAATYSRNALATKLVANALGAGELVPDLIEVQAHGGFFELEEYLGPYEAETSRTHGIMQVADGLANRGRFAEAISTYEKVLQIDPSHTVALHNLANAQAQLKDITSAFRSEGRVLEIEPNWRQYQAAYIEYAAGCGRIRAAIDQFEATKAQFAFHNSDDTLGIELYLVSGNPRKARDLLKASLVDPDQRKELQQKVTKELAGKRRAAKFLKQAKESVLSSKPDGLVELLERAYSAYEQDPFTSISLGFALLREGDYQRAKQLLLSKTDVLPLYMFGVCLANAAFAEIRSSNHIEAMKLLKATTEYLIVENNNEEPTDLGTLPGIGIWSDEEGTIEELPDSALALINQAIEQLSKEEVPNAVRRLAELYKARIEQLA
jgi:tetratricopeptide (TPR) repeat protein